MIYHVALLTPGCANHVGMAGERTTRQVMRQASRHTSAQGHEWITPGYHGEAVPGINIKVDFRTL